MKNNENILNGLKNETIVFFIKKPKKFYNKIWNNYFELIRFRKIHALPIIICTILNTLVSELQLKSFENFPHGPFEGEHPLFVSECKYTVSIYIYFFFDL